MTIGDSLHDERCPGCGKVTLYSEAADILPDSEICQCIGRRLSQVAAERVTWRWKHRIPAGKVTLIDGDPGEGKSVMTTDFAARVTVGRDWPDGSPCEQGNVVILSAEDSEADTIRPRLDAAGGDASKVLALPTVPDDPDRLITIPDDLDVLRQAVDQERAKLVIIDPLMAFLSADINAHRDMDVRRALAPVARLAEATGAAVVVVRHLNKSSGGNPLYRGGGSIGIVGAARSALLVARHPEQDDLRVLAGLKSNLAPPTPSLTFALIQADNGAVRVEWKGESHMSADTLLALPVDEDQRQELADLRDVVKDLLEDENGTWEGKPNELHGELTKRDEEAVPKRPDELTKRLMKLSRSQAGFKVSRTRKRDNDGNVSRVLKLERVHRSKPVNAVHGGNGVNGVPGTTEDVVNSVNTVNADTGFREGVHTGGEEDFG